MEPLMVNGGNEENGGLFATQNAGQVPGTGLEAAIELDEKSKNHSSKSNQSNGAAGMVNNLEHKALITAPPVSDRDNLTITEYEYLSVSDNKAPEVMINTVLLNIFNFKNVRILLER